MCRADAVLSRDAGNIALAQAQGTAESAAEQRGNEAEGGALGRTRSQAAYTPAVPVKDLVQAVFELASAVTC